MPQRILALFLFVCCAAAAVAQPTAHRWGNVPPEHLAMREFPADPDAQAVILQDVADILVERDGTVEYLRHRRVKVLGEGAYSLATVSLVYDTSDRSQSVDRVRGQTFVPQPDGSVRRVALDRSGIFTENLQGGRRRITFTLPALEPGAVFEYSYRYENASPLLIPRWDFQESEPVLYSEYRVEHPRTFAYTFLTPNAPFFTVNTQERGSRAGGETTIRRWVLVDVPALREEPYMTTLDDHLIRLEGQLSEHFHPRLGPVKVLGSWEELATTLRDHPDLGRALRVPRGLRRQAETLTAGVDGDEARARALYDFVRTSVSWDGRRRVFTESPLARVLEAGRGTAAEANLLLVALLREAGLTAEPVLLSTRDNGAVIEGFPLVSQFNLTAAAVRLGGRWTLLDATDPVRPFGMLPAEALNHRAWVVGERPEWVGVPPGQSAHRIHLTGEVSPEGTLVGTIRSERSGYSGAAARRAVREHGASGYLTDALLDGVAGLGVADARVEHEDDLEEALVATASVRLDGYLQTAAGLSMMHVKPLLREDENPFRRETRTFPVDFAYPRTVEFTAEVRLPEGYTVDESPGRSFFVLPNSGGVYERSLDVRDGVMHVAVRRTLLRSRMDPPAYPALREFFERVASAERDVLVLRPTASAELQDS